MLSRARAARAAGGTIISPVDQLLNEKRPARNPRARRLLASSGKRIIIITTSYPGHVVAATKLGLNSETYTFDAVPSSVSLATVPGFSASFTGMSAVYLETNGVSTVNESSGLVFVDQTPP
jgi:hypothetical protein